MTSRAQRILQCVASRPFPCVFDMVFKAVRAGEPEDVRSNGTLRQAVSAQLKQLVDAKKLRRTGTAGAYLYHATKLTHLDLRRVDTDGMPRTKSRDRRPNAKPRPPAKPVVVRPPQPARVVAATPNPSAGKPARLPHQRLVIVPVSPTPSAPKHPERESVEQFLARGGRIQKLAHGASSDRPLGYHEQSKAHREKQKALPKKARKPTTTD